MFLNKNIVTHNTHQKLFKIRTYHYFFYMVSINGFKFIDGSAEGFSVENIEGYDKNTLYFIRTDADGENGYLYINGKKYCNY